MKNELLKIIQHYGVNAQQRKLAEEVFELQEAIIQYEEPRRYRDTSHIVEEIADVIVILKQFIDYYDLDDEEINKIAKAKVERQLERIKNE